MAELTECLAGFPPLVGIDGDDLWTLPVTIRFASLMGLDLNRFPCHHHLPHSPLGLHKCKYIALVVKGAHEGIV